MVTDVFIGLAEGNSLLNEAKKADCHQCLVGKVGAIIIALAMRT